MVDFLNIVKITTIFQDWILSHEISDLQTCNPGVKKSQNFLKNRFLSSESVLEWLLTQKKKKMQILRKT